MFAWRNLNASAQLCSQARQLKIAEFLAQRESGKCHRSHLSLPDGKAIGGRTLYHRRQIAIFCLVMIGLTACTNQERRLQGTLLVWHTWPGVHGDMLTTSIDSFVEVNPGVVIVSEYVPGEDLLSRFRDQAAAGLGPDLLLGVSPATVRQLATADLLVDLAPYEPDLSKLNANAVDALRLNKSLPGLPISAYTPVLFYNRRSVEQPPQTLDEVLTVARSGQIFAFPTCFRHSFWGLRGIDGVSDGTQDAFAITGALPVWLRWLQRAQAEPNMVLSDDEDELDTLFASGRATYYIGESIHLPALRQRLGEEHVGVAPLPDGSQIAAKINVETETATELPFAVHQPPGAFLELEIAAISRISARKELALQLILFLANPVHQRRLASSDLGHVPVNQRVRYDHRLSPSQSTIVRQSATAVVIPLRDIPAMGILGDVADGVYAQVMEGVLEPDEASDQIFEDLNLVIEETNQ